MKFKLLKPDDSGFLYFTSLLDQAKAKLYPDGPSFPKIERDLDLVLGLFEEDELIASGALYLFKDYAEVKRLFVLPKRRGQGLSRKIMDELERLASQNKVKCIKLETGIRQPAAIGLYKSLGFKETKAFHPYFTHEYHLYFEKKLTNERS